MRHMKWWGWGDEGVAFRHDDKPAFAGFVKSALDIDVSRSPLTGASLESLSIPDSKAPEDLRACLRAAIGTENVKDDSLDRIVHAYGKGLRDLVRIRRGDLGRVADGRVHPVAGGGV